ncbi:MAG: hypothetical protein VW683_02720 [Betaproteobacteria bacterium]
MTKYIYNDGGRSNYFKGTAGDCAVRAMAIALELDYKQVYNELAQANAKGRGGVKSARNGIYKEDFNRVLESHGWTWVPAPKFDGRKAYVGDMPKGRVIARMAKHFVAVINGVAYDTWDSTEKMIYGYWAKA